MSENAGSAGPLDLLVRLRGTDNLLKTGLYAEAAKELEALRIHLEIMRGAFKNVCDSCVPPEFYREAMREYERGCKGEPNESDWLKWPNLKNIED